MDEIYRHAFRVCAILDTQAFKFLNYCGFSIEPFCSDVCGDHRCPQTLEEICRNMALSCGFRAVAAREKYPGLSYFVFPMLMRIGISNCNWHLYVFTGRIGPTSFYKQWIHGYIKWYGGIFMAVLCVRQGRHRSLRLNHFPQCFQNDKVSYNIAEYLLEKAWLSHISSRPTFILALFEWWVHMHIERNPGIMVLYWG